MNEAFEKWLKEHPMLMLCEEKDVVALNAFEAGQAAEREANKMKINRLKKEML